MRTRGSISSLLVLVGLASLGVLASPREARAEPLRHEGKTLDEWVKQANGSQEEKSREALRALGRARFLVVASDTVVPELEKFLTGRGVEHFIAAHQLAEYGPLAARSDLALALHKDLTGSLLIARIRIGKHVQPLLQTLEERWTKARNALLKGEKNASSNLVDEVRRSAQLGSRGESAVAFAKSLIDDEKTAMWVTTDLTAAAHQWGPVSGPLAPLIVRRLDEKDPEIRGRAATALAWTRTLEPGQSKAFFAAAKSFGSGPHALPITKGVARTAEHPVDAALAHLKTRASSTDPEVAAWATAGLARRVPEAERARLVPIARGQLKHVLPEARAGGADTLLALRDLCEPLRADLQTALADVDLRVRWRAAAILLRWGPDPAAITELARGIESPDDRDRVAAFEAIRALGPAAAPLAAPLEAWTMVPFEWLRGHATRAREAVRGK